MDFGEILITGLLRNHSYELYREQTTGYVIVWHSQHSPAAATRLSLHDNLDAAITAVTNETKGNVVWS